MPPVALKMNVLERAAGGTFRQSGTENKKKRSAINDDILILGGPEEKSGSHDRNKSWRPGPTETRAYKARKRTSQTTTRDFDGIPRRKKSACPRRTDRAPKIFSGT